jgi:mevalonate kinase
MALAYGKVILVGEHAVVYGAPAIALGIGVAATATARLAEHSSLTLGARRWDLTQSFADPAASTEVRAFAALLESIGGDRAAPGIEAEAQLYQPSGVGLGASAAIGVALARASSEALGTPADQRPAQEILSAAQAWENVFHGTASGIDAAAAYYGGCLWFRRSSPAEPLRLRQPIQIAIAVAGPAVSTRLMVESVAAFRKSNPRRFERLIYSIHGLVEEARAALLLGRHRELGGLLDRNHRLASDLGVSTPGLDFACQLARDAGALGAKLTGGGGGGCVMALTEPESSARVLAAWRERGLHCFEASVQSSTLV